jgi:flagellin-like hook-associated protein FlgL
MNGQDVQLEGTTANISTQDIKGELRFNEGELGKTTIGAAGYDVGALYSGATEINNRDSHATNPFHNTSEILNNFTGGMQFQLGEGASDMERTVFSIQSMAVQNLGRVRFVDDFEGKGIIETRQLSLGDILGGGTAALANDPVKALGIIEQAISDVSTLRARLGAAQTNLLQTNANSLGVAIENIVKTESVIRDADMAKETTAFTKNQILVSAGTSMLAQANTMAQNVLQLLG